MIETIARFPDHALLGYSGHKLLMHDLSNKETLKSWDVTTPWAYDSRSWRVNQRQICIGHQSLAPLPRPEAH
jgi:hypothetical protein